MDAHFPHSGRSFVRVFFWGEEGAGREGPLHHPGNPKGKSAKLKARRWPSRGDRRAEEYYTRGRKEASFANFNAQA